MSSNPAPFMSNIYKIKWPIDTEILCFIKDHLEFDKNFKNILQSWNSKRKTFLDLPVITEIKQFRVSSMIREMYSLFLLFLCDIWPVKFHQILNVCL